MPPAHQQRHQKDHAGQADIDDLQQRPLEGRLPAAAAPRSLLVFQPCSEHRHGGAEAEVAELLQDVQTGRGGRSFHGNRVAGGQGDVVPAVLRPLDADRDADRLRAPGRWRITSTSSAKGLDTPPASAKASVTRISWLGGKVNSPGLLTSPIT